jgi:2,3-bisphosphoglycerate-independent phosphoglycerate mutase
MHETLAIRSLLAELRDGSSLGKIVLVVADGLGGLPLEPGGKTELEVARTPNLDACARDGLCGLLTPILPGITPGCVAGHLALFGYDPLEYRIARGVIDALSINFPVEPGDIAIRASFCGVDAAGMLVTSFDDRKATRLATERCLALCHLLASIRIPGVQIFLEPIREHRFVLVLRPEAQNESYGDALNDTTPVAVGKTILQTVARDPESQATAKVLNAFVTEASKILKDQMPANMITLQGFGRVPKLPPMSELFGLRCLAAAVYPVYRGLARLVGMDVVDCGTNLGDQVESLKAYRDSYDLLYLHHKYPDSAGLDGNFAAKVEMIERLDEEIPRLRNLNAEVLIVTGDHSTPSKLRTQSWHPVPTLLVSRTARPDRVAEFGEEACLRGGLGQFQAKHLMPLALAHAGRLRRVGD